MGDDKGPREFGHIFKRGRIYWVRYSVNGRRRRESTGSTSRRAAEQLLAKRQAELGLGVYNEVDVRRVTFADLLALLENHCTTNGLKSEARTAHLEAFFDAGTKAITITTDRVEAYKAHRLGEEAAPATINRELASLRKAFNLAIESGRLTKGPVIKLLPERNVRDGFLEPGEYDKLLAELPAHLKPVLIFGYHTGWRRGEILNLTWACVDFAAEVVRLPIGSTKNESGRTFPFGAMPAMRDMLIAQREATTAIEKETRQLIPWVFHYRRGKPLSDFRKSWSAACERAGVPGLLLHDLRRTAVRNLERANVPRSIAMNLTGHKTESVYRRYDIVDENDLAAGVESVAAYLESVPKERSKLANISKASGDR